MRWLGLMVTLGGALACVPRGGGGGGGGGDDDRGVEADGGVDDLGPAVDGGPLDGGDGDGAPGDASEGDGGPEPEPEPAPEPEPGPEPDPEPEPCMEQPEACNGIDDDCDGRIDEGTGGEECGTGLPGICRDGFNFCDRGATRCVPAVDPGAEQCDGRDNDCNGVIDDVPGVGDGCEGELDGCLGNGRIACGPRGLYCEINEIVGGPEVCDALDNDCDGVVDEEGCPEDCGNRVDDDGDGDIDCADRDCFGIPPCEAVDGVPLGLAQGYGHHGNCETFNDCGDAETCAGLACRHFGLGEPLSFLEGPCSTVAEDIPGFVCNLFNNLDPQDLDERWGPSAGCNILVAFDIYCEP